MCGGMLADISAQGMKCVCVCVCSVCGKGSGWTGPLAGMQIVSGTTSLGYFLAVVCMGPCRCWAAGVVVQIVGPGGHVHGFMQVQVEIHRIGFAVRVSWWNTDGREADQVSFVGGCSDGWVAVFRVLGIQLAP